jgi:imidazolonepropionase
VITKLFRNALIFTPVDTGIPSAGERQGEIKHYEKGTILCRNGIIEKIGTEDDLLRSLVPKDVEIEIDCRGFCLIPGFVDPHTHMCFAKRREGEFKLRLQGTPYLEILRSGGGILSSVRAVRAASEKEILEITLEHALFALRLGTTTLEIKSGYGLDTETELKMLRVIEQVRRETPQDVVATFLGAHAIPEEFRNNPEGFVDLVIEEMLPAVSQQGIAQFCDVFCEEGVFSLEQSRRILKAARETGFDLKIHADEVHDLGGAGLAAELQSVSAEHLLAASDANLTAMAAAGVIGVLLPGTAYSLRKPYARARKMVELGVPLALASDCNPGSCYTESMPFIFGLAVLQMGLSLEEALVASTLNAAYSIRMAERVGSLGVGKQADFILLDGESPAILAYHAGVSPVVEVYKRGERVAEIR